MENKNQLKAMEDIGLLVEDKMREILNNKGVDNTGALSLSIMSELKATDSDIPYIELSYLYYGQFVDQGRRAGAKQPPVNDIERWLREKGIQPKPGITLKSLAFVIARSIGRRGIRPRPFVMPSLEAIAIGDNSIAAEMLAEAGAKDIAAGVTDILETVNIKA